MRRHELLIVVLERLQPCNVADRPQRQTADLAHALGNVVGYPENLLGLFVEQQMVVAKVWSAHVPMEVLSLHIKRKDIGQNSIELFRDLTDGLGGQVSRGVQNRACFAARIESSHFVVHGITLRNIKDIDERAAADARGNAAPGFPTNAEGTTLVPSLMP